MKTNVKFLTVLATLVAGVVFASEVTEEMAAKAVGNWRTRKKQLGLTLGRTVKDARSVEFGGAKFYIVRMEGGGVVITPTDTSKRPVILFSDGDDFEVSAENPAMALLTSELGCGEEAQSTDAPDDVPGAKLMAMPAPSPHEREWKSLLSDTVFMTATSIDDVRVGPLVQSRWNQTKAGDEYCYNYYTPKHYYCGCVATTAAQLMRYFEYPKGLVDKFTGKYVKVDGVVTPTEAQGGVYNWSEMPYKPTGSTPENQRQEIGKLTSDLGIAMAMDYKSSGSGTGGYMIQYAFCKRYNYSHVAAGLSTSSAQNDDFGNALRANFDAKLPVGLTISNHSIIGDGYGYIGDTLYYHLNYGWGDSAEICWYAPPDLADGKKIFKGACYNIYTDQNAKLVITSGRVTYGNKAMKGIRVAALDDAGSEVATAETDEHGIYALFVNPGKYAISATGKEYEDSIPIGEYAGSCSASPAACKSDLAGGKATEKGGYSNIKGRDRGVGGNASGCDIKLVYEPYDPEGTAGVTGHAMGVNFEKVTVSGQAQVLHYGLTAKEATTKVRLTPVGGGTPIEANVDNLTIEDFEAHSFDVTLTGLTAGVRYEARAILVVGGSEIFVGDAYEFSAAKEEQWFEEYAVAELPGTYTPIEKWFSTAEITASVRFANAYESMADLPTDLGPLAIATVLNDDNTQVFAFWNGAAWEKKSNLILDEAALNKILLVADMKSDLVRVKIQRGETDTWHELGEIPFANIGLKPHIQFGIGLADVCVNGKIDDANLLKGEDGNEYFMLADVIANGVEGALTPLWNSTANLTEALGDRKIASVTIDFSNGLLSLTEGDGAWKTEPDGNKITYHLKQSDVSADCIITETKDNGKMVDLVLPESYFKDKSKAQVQSEMAENGANDLPKWQSVALGLDSNDATSKPFLRSVQNEENDTIAFKLGGVDCEKNETGVLVYYAVESAENLDFTNPKRTEASAGASTVTVEVPTSDQPVRYYRARFDFR